MMMSVKFLTIFALLSLGICNITFSKVHYEFANIPPYLVNFAKYKGWHDVIVSKAYKRKITAQSFSHFYSSSVKMAMKEIHCPYINALEEINFDPNSAIRKYKNALKSNPNLSENYFFMGMAYEKLYLYKKALQNYNKAIELDPQGYDGIIYEKLADLYAKLGFYENAIVNLNKSLQVVGDKISAVLQVADLYFEIADYENSANALKEFFKLSYPDSVLTQKQALGIECEVLSYRGYAIEGCENLENYYKSFLKNVSPPLEKQILEIEYEIQKKAGKLNIKDNEKLSYLYGEYAYRQSIIATGYPYLELKKAIALATKEVSFRRDATSYGRRGALKYSLAVLRGDSFMSAAGDFLHAARLAEGKEKIPYYLALADIYSRYGLYENALSKLNDALDIDPENIHLCHLISYVNLKKKDYFRAENYIGEYLDREKNKNLSDKASKGFICKILVLSGRKVKGCSRQNYFYSNPCYLPAEIIGKDDILRMQSVL